MSKFKTLVTELKKILSDIPVQETMSVSAEDLVISDLKVGGKVEAKDSEGNVIPAPDGEYTIGSDLIVVKDGLIESLNGETEAAPEEQMDETPAPTENDVQSQIDEIKADIESIKSSIEDLKNSVVSVSKDDSNKFTIQVKELNDSIKALMETPAEFSKTNKTNAYKEAKEIKMNEWSKVLAKSVKVKD